MFAGFHSINIPTKADVKRSTINSWLQAACRSGLQNSGLVSLLRNMKLKRNSKCLLFTDSRDGRESLLTAGGRGAFTLPWSPGLWVPGPGTLGHVSQPPCQLCQQPTLERAETGRRHRRYCAVSLTLAKGADLKCPQD